MRSITIPALFALLVLPGVASAQSGPQTAAADAASAASPAPAAVAGGITREQYIRRAEERAGRRAAGQFDGMDTNHDGVLDAAEMRAWRAQHARRAPAAAEQPRPQ